MQIRTRAFVAVALALVIGRLTDLTTGQPLTGVTITVAGSSAHGVTDENGNFRLKNVAAGAHALSLQSSDVPPQTRTITVGKGAKTLVHIVACSTTLDYSCAAP